MHTLIISFKLNLNTEKPKNRNKIDHANKHTVLSIQSKGTQNRILLLKVDFVIKIIIKSIQSVYCKEHKLALQINMIIPKYYQI